MSPRTCLAAAQESLEAASRAGDLLTEAYLSQILQNRLASTGKLTTHLGCMLSDEPDKVPGSAQWPHNLQCLPDRRLLEADRPIGGKIPLGPARRPACLVPAQGAGNGGGAR